MFHTSFIHGHAHWPPLPPIGKERDEEEIHEGRQFYGSVQPAIFNGPREWTEEVRELVEKCLVRIAPVMKKYGEAAPGLETFKD